MQVFNKTSIKNTFAHTWYLYPVAIALVSVIWIWSFNVYHQPTTHQKLNLFFSTEIHNESFLNDIKNDHYEREKLREVTPSYALPTSVGYYSKLQVALSNSDLLILDETTLAGFEHQYETSFVKINDYIKNNYLNNDYTFYKFNEEDYAVLIKEKETTHYLSSYMTFDESQNYYLVLSSSSKNLGPVLDEGNAYYDNALTYTTYLLTGDL